MKIELNDETLTAYALGELTDAEVEAVDKKLAEAASEGNTAPRDALSEIRNAISISESAFATESGEGLAPAQRSNVVQLAETPGRGYRFPWKAAGLAAAVLMILAGYGAVSMYESEVYYDLVALTPSGKEAAEEARDNYEVAQKMKEVIRHDLQDPAMLASGVDVPNFNDPRVQDQLKQEVSLMTRRLSQVPDSASTSSPTRSMQAETRNPSSSSTATETLDSRTFALGGNAALRWNPVQQPEATESGGGAATSEEREQIASVGYQVNPTQADPAVTQDRDQLEALGYLGDNDSNQPANRRLLEPKKETLTAIRIDEGAKQAAAGRQPGADGRIRENITLDNSDRLRMSRADIGFRYQPARPPITSPGAEAYKPIIERGFTRVTDEPLSTFSIDVDTASYANVRRFLQQGQLPPPDAVRVEEMINYFDYAYGQPEGNVPFAAHFELAPCPWEPGHKLVRIGLKGREIPRAERPASNLVFLIDVSGSMQPTNKLPLVKSAMSQLTRQLDERDTVSIVTYASGVSVPLQPTNASDQQTILHAINSLGAGGSTNGAGGIQTAYQLARQHYLPGGVNRVILATDGDFNVGTTDNAQLEQMIQAEARTGVFLSVYGYGMGNLKDDRLEMLADKGNGHYGYIDSEVEAHREFVEKLSGTLVTIAKDVKIQVEFNPSRVSSYRLVGYENRALAAQDFNNDRKDAGEIGAGHTVTALYEVVPAGRPVPTASGSVDALRYQPVQPAPQLEAARVAPDNAHANELLLVKLRYKEPTADTSQLLEFPLSDSDGRLEAASGDFKFASAVAAFGKLLRGNPLGSELHYDGMIQLAQAGLLSSTDPHRAEIVSLMMQARPMIEAWLPSRDVVWSSGYLR